MNRPRSNSGRRNRNRRGPRPQQDPNLGPNPNPNVPQDGNTAPLSLEQRCVRQFPKSALARGREYFSRGRVSEPTWVGPECSVMVNGSGGRYDVCMDFSQVTTNGVLPMSCSCPAYAKGATCKHLWSAILQTEKKSLPGTIPESGTLRIQRERPGPGPRRDHRAPMAPPPAPINVTPLELV